jgi:hypothetical protein
MISEKEYWNKKYSDGGISGRGSIGFYRNWKWNKIQQTIGIDYDSLIDVGCGDLSFWNHPIAKKCWNQRNFKYVGIDVSDHIIKRNRKLHPKWDWIAASAHIEQTGKSAQVVFALDLLFHIMNDEEFKMTLENLCNYAEQFLIIYTWKRNPFEVQNVVTDGVSQYFRNLLDFKQIFLKNKMKLQTTYNVPYDSFGRMYIFKRIGGEI